jgi:hypothetical protein
LISAQKRHRYAEVACGKRTRMLARRLRLERAKHERLGHDLAIDAPAVPVRSLHGR